MCSVVESGGKSDFQYGQLLAASILPARVDRVLHDGDKVANWAARCSPRMLTPGHTKGCTTWTMRPRKAARHYNVVIVGSPNMNPGYRLVNNAEYPPNRRGLSQDLPGPEVSARPMSSWVRTPIISTARPSTRA